MQAFCDRSFIESQLQCLNPTKYNKYYWWRRYETRKELDKKTPLYEKIKHGDYDPSDYLYQMEHEFYLMKDKLVGIKHPDERHEIAAAQKHQLSKRLVIELENVLLKKFLIVL